MADICEVLPDGTLRFLPNRLNRQPVVVLGLTADEMWLSVALSLISGLILGVGIAVLAQSVAMIPTVIFACVALGLSMGGKFLRRLKRGRPQTWLYRQMQWYIRLKWPTLTTWSGGSDLITRSGRWTTRRSGRP
ncbi:TIGR03750 family conjugal transfer protein [Pseudomonas cichorii]|nr:TIGR03750 family conjugal transfer protein [Pseudomonas cichorii]MBX8554346.1 TIGR03750 family conjugal transfer protein [Pseudomonas cichorii]